MKAYIFICSILSSCFYPSIVTANVNWINDAGTLHSYSGPYRSGDSSDYDGNWDTNWQTYLSGCCFANTWFEHTATHMFVNPLFISQIKFHISGIGWTRPGASENSAGYNVKVQYTIDGSNWITIPNASWYYYQSGYSDASFDSDIQFPDRTYNINAIIRGVRFYSSILCYESHSPAAGGDEHTETHAWEIEAWGPASPTVSTSDACDITSSQGTLNGNITDTGGENAVERGFEWGTSPGSYTYSLTESGSFGTGAFSYEITRLTRQTTYYFRAKAHNSVGWSYGLEKSFSTSCFVNIYDLAAFCEQWLQTGANLEADLDSGGTVDFIDYSILANSWLNNCPPDWPLK